MATGLSGDDWLKIVLSSSVIGSLTSLAVTTGKDWLKERAKVQADKQHSALDVAVMLEGYAGSLSDLISSINEHYGRGYPDTHGGNLPDLPPVPEGFDRKAFGIKGTAKLSEFRTMVEDHRGVIASNYQINEPDWADRDMLEVAPVIALQALELAASFRKRNRLPARKFDGEYNLKTGLEYALERAERAKAERAAREAQQAAEHAAWSARTEADVGLAKGSYLVSVTQGEVDRAAAGLGQTD